jgi:arylsulfatase A-like enzyme
MDVTQAKTFLWFRIQRLCLALFVMLQCGAMVEDARGAGKPNILFLLSDDQAWTDYSFMGHEMIQTPNIDALAKDGVLFRRGYVPTPLCRPSLMSLATGHYASTHGVTGNDPSRKRYTGPAKNEARAALIAKIDAFDTLPELLVEQGYVCHQSGKWWEGNFSRGGFTHGMTRGFPKPGGRHGDDGLKIGRNGLAACTDFIDMAVEDEKPFYMWYAPFMPHTPHTPPQEYLAKYEGRVPLPVAKYYAMCEWFDATCGELLAHLDAKGIRENTLVIYVGDNGWIQHPERANRYDKRSKQTCYEGGIRQPTIYSWPGTLAAQDRPDLVNSIDIFPTILAAAGARQPARAVPGLNLLDAMKMKTPVKREAIFGESFAHDIADLDDPEKSLLYRWCIKGRWKLLLSYGGEVGPYASSHDYDKVPQLFDLTDDPHEKNNLAKDKPGVVAELASAIDAWYPLKSAKLLP